MTSSTVSLPTLSVFRIKRKRTADPHEALLISLKRPRLNLASKPFAPMLYHLATTSEVPDVAAFGKMAAGQQFNIIDYVPPIQSSSNDSASNTKKEEDDENPLSLLNDAVNEIGFFEKQTTSKDLNNQQITLNGVQMASVDAPHVTDNYVFDFYWNVHGFDYTVDQVEVRPARPDELELYAGEDTESSTGADDDDDSNREDNWRNDYPEELSDESGGSEVDENAQFDSGSESFAELNRRLDNCDFYSSDNEDIE